MAVPRVAKLVGLQHNCARGGQVMEAVLESAVKKRADLVLIQEPRGEGEMDSTRSHPSFQFLEGRMVKQPSAGWWLTGSLGAR